MQYSDILKRLPQALGCDLLSGRITLWAGSMVYTTLLSLVPLMAISFALLKAFGVHNQLYPVLLELLSPLGEHGVTIGNNILTFVERVQVGVLSAIGIAFLFVTVVLMIAKIEDSLNEQWQLHESRPWHRRISYYITTLMLTPLIVFSAITFLGSLFQSTWLQSLLSPTLLGSVISIFYLLLPIVLTITAFTLIYLFLPHTHVKLAPAFQGALFATLSWKLAGWIFALLISKASSYDAIYSSFAILIVLILWLYLTWLIFILGGRVAFYLQHPHALNHYDENGNPDQELLALNVMRLIALAFKEGKEAPSRAALCSALKQPDAVIASILEQLQGKRLIRQQYSGFYTPARALDSITLHEIIAAVQLPHQEPSPLTECLPLSEGRETVQQGLKQQLQAISLSVWITADAYRNNEK